MKYLTGLPKSRQPIGKSYTVLKESFNESLVDGKFKFTELIVSELNIFPRD